MMTVRSQPGCHSGFTLIEVVVCTFVVGVLVVAAMRVSAFTQVAQYRASERATARQLADGLMSDILQLNYQDPGLLPVFGIELTELLTSKVAYNDIDDFNGWSESPPQDRGGNRIDGFTGWQRSVAVAWVSVTDPTQTSLLETGVKRITVTVKHNGAVLATRVALRTNAQ